MRSPRTIYIKISTELLAELGEWSGPVEAKVIQAADDTFELNFRTVNVEAHTFECVVDESAGFADSPSVGAGPHNDVMGLAE